MISICNQIIPLLSTFEELKAKDRECPMALINQIRRKKPISCNGYFGQFDYLPIMLFNADASVQYKKRRKADKSA